MARGVFAKPRGTGAVSRFAGKTEPVAVLIRVVCMAVMLLKGRGTVRRRYTRHQAAVRRAREFLGGAGRMGLND